MLPSRACEASEARPFRVRAALPAGAPFDVTFYNDSRVWSKTVRYKVLAAPLPLPGGAYAAGDADGGAAGPGVRDGGKAESADAAVALS